MLLPLLLLFSPSVPPEPVTVAGAERFDVRSKLGRDYRIFFAVPPGEAPAAGWPVIYLTDGNGNFPLLLSAVRRRMAVNAAVVGIGYPTDDAKIHGERRTYDLTPPTSAEWLKTLPKGPPLGKAGGNGEFLTFL